MPEKPGWRRVLRKKWAPAWVSISFSLALKAVERWDLAQSVLAKFKAAEPVLAPVIALLLSDWLQLGLILFAVGYVYAVAQRREESSAPVRPPKAERGPCLPPEVDLAVKGAMAKPWMTPTPPAQSARIVGVMSPVSVTPEYLVGLCDGQSTIQAKVLTAPHIGNRLPVSGRLENVYDCDEGQYDPVHSCHAILRRESSGRIWLSLQFDEPHWRNRLLAVPIGETIDVIGQIEDISQSTIKLNHCELVETSSSGGSSSAGSEREEAPSVPLQKKEGED